MKIALLFFKLSVLAAILVLQPSCKKGDKGDPGEPGADGRDGNANVIYSDWFTPTSYIKDTLFGIWGFRHDQPVPEITQAVLDSGAVLTYAKLLGYNPAVWPNQQVAPMPIQITYMQGGVTTDTWSAFSTAGNLRIRFVNDRNIYTSISTTHQFRYIIIPGGKKAGMGVNLRNNGLNNSVNLILQHHEQMDYNDVCRLLKIGL